MESRTGASLAWNTDRTEDREVRLAVDAMLAEPLTIDRAAQIALLNNPELQASLEDLGVAQADLVQAGLLKNPVFDLGVRFPTAPPSKTYLDFSIADDFVGILMIPARRKIAANQLETVKADTTAQAIRICGEARLAVIECQAAAQQVELRQSIADAASAGALAAKRLNEAGNNTELDLANADAQLARAQTDLADARLAEKTARERLNVVMGLIDPPAWTLSSRLADLPPTEQDLHDLQVLAMRRRPDLAAARARVELQASLLGFTSQTRFFSDVELGAEAERETDGQWRIGPRLAVPVPLFDQGQAAIPRQQALFRQSQRRYQAQAVKACSEVRIAREMVVAARARVESYRDRLMPLAAKVLQQTQLQYNGMLVGVFQLLEARQGQIDTARQSIDALRAYWAARIQLEQVIGGRP